MRGRVLASVACAGILAIATSTSAGCGSGSDTHGSGGAGGGSGGSGGAPGPCPKGQLRDDTGTCQSLGIQGCVDAFIGSDGLCRPSMEACKKGEIPIFGEGCVAVGIPGCADVFLENDGICHPKASKCPADSIPVPKRGCVPLDGPNGCGAAPWGAIPDDAKNVYVDPSYLGGDGDGSKAKPLTTIGDALSIVAQGGRIALAAGDYPEAPVIAAGLEVEIAGRCPSMVTVSGNDGDAQQPVVVRTHGILTLRGVTISGDGVGVFVASGSTTLDHVAISGALDAGLIVQKSAGADLQDTLVSGTRDVDLADGFGLVARSGSVLDVTDSAILGSHTAGIFATGYHTLLEVTDSLVEGTASETLFYDGDAIDVFDQAFATIDSSALVGSDAAAIRVQMGGAEADAKHVVLEGDPNAASGLGSTDGAAVFAGGKLTVASSVLTKLAFEAFHNEEGSASLSRSLLDGGGVLLFISGTTDITDSAIVRAGSAAVRAAALDDLHLLVQGVLIEDSVPLEGEFGMAIASDGGATVDIDSVFALRSKVAGFLYDKKASGKISHSVVSGVALGDYQSEITNKKEKAGDGVVAGRHAKVTVEGVLVEKCARAGLLFSDSGDSVSWSETSHNAIGVVLDGTPKPTIDHATVNADNDQPEVTDGMLVAPTAPAAL